MVLWYGRSCTRSVWSDIVSWRTRRLSNSIQSIYSMHRWPPLQRRRNKICWRIVTSTCSQIVLKCLYLAHIGRPDILWSVNKLARSITEWTKRLSPLISYIHHTCEYTQCCHMGNTAEQCRLGLFQDSDFAWDLEDSKSTSGGTLCIFGKLYVCSNQLDVQETNFSFAQFNRIRNHFLGCRIKDGRYTRTWFMGSDRRSSWKHESESYKEQGDLVMNKREVRSTPHTIRNTRAISESVQCFQ